MLEGMLTKSWSMVSKGLDAIQFYARESTEIVIERLSMLREAD